MFENREIFPAHSRDFLTYSPTHPHPTLSTQLRLYCRMSLRHSARSDEFCRFMRAAAAAWEVIQRSIKPQQLSWDGCAGWDRPLQPAEAHTPVVHPLEQQFLPLRSRKHPGWAQKGEQILPSALPIASPLILVLFFFFDLGKFGFLKLIIQQEVTAGV